MSAAPSCDGGGDGGGGTIDPSIFAMKCGPCARRRRSERR
jgi:hypothetical protein